MTASAANIPSSPVQGFWETLSVWTDKHHHLDVTFSPHTGARPVMFVHGWGLSARSYLEPLAAMTEWCQVFAPSLPGFGHSTPLPRAADNTLDGYASAVVRAWEAADLPEPMPLVAHSMGCGISVRIAQLRPDLVSSLVLVCPIGGAGKHPVSWLKLAGSLAREAHVSFVPRMADSGPAMLRNVRGAVRAGYSAKTADLRADIDSLVASGLQITLVAADDDGVVPPGPLQQSAAHFIHVSGAHGWLLRRPHEFADIIHPYVFPTSRRIRRP